MKKFNGLRLLKITGYCLLLTLVTAGCSGVHLYQEMLDESFKGQSIDRMVQEFGQPDEKSSGSYTWRKSRDWTKAGYWSSYRQTVDVYDSKGQVIGTAEVDTPYYQEPITYNYWCNTRAFFNESKIVTGFEFAGSSLTVDDHNNGCFVDEQKHIFDKNRRVFRRY